MRLILIMLAVLAWTAPARADDLLDRLSHGVWGNEGFDDQHCADNPHRIEVEDGGRRLVFIWRTPILYHTGEKKQRIGAAVVARTADRLVVVQDGEDRMGLDGVPTRFDVFLLPSGGYCFIMTSLDATDCPRKNLPCQGLPSLS